MIEYRRIRLADVDALAHLALSAIPDEPEVAVSVQKVVSMVTFFALHQDHFQLAAFEGDKPVAGLAMLVTEMPFHERSEGTIVFCFSRLPGAGFRLLRALMVYVREHMQIRRVSWALNRDADPRTAQLARRLGFQSAHPTLMYYKGG